MLNEKVRDQGVLNAMRVGYSMAKRLRSPLGTGYLKGNVPILGTNGKISPVGTCVQSKKSR
jgi:hypothetical protein